MFFQKVTPAIALLFFHFLGFGQLTLQIYALPASTPENMPVFVAGNFNGWNPGDPTYQLKRQGDAQYSLTLPDLASPYVLEFKFTGGSWAAVEGNPNGDFTSNRTYSYQGGTDTLRLAVQSWEHIDAPRGSTAGPNVKIIATDFDIPQLNRKRRIWICLPVDYDGSTKRYPVLYMNDGQNLFDAANSFSGEWRVDEAMEWRTGEGGQGCIIVGIDNGGEHRIDEYSPWLSEYGGGEGDEYAAFLTQTLKPYIDKNYRTLKSRRFTGIMGSSMGGLITLYTSIEYQQTFGFAGIFSPSLWLSDQWLEQVRQTGQKRSMRFYILAGKYESETMEQQCWLLARTLQESGFSADQIAVDIDEDGAHSEWYWSREFPGVIRWWLGN
ncbi:MAG: alpha/beta hydrolase [Saprospirales bacterium]|nr:alpha/beta hydrolase [Saprospirales bacterium]MBK8491980.1 alpha/beta hydrolase [Saprospirales bacterium]